MSQFRFWKFFFNDMACMKICMLSKENSQRLRVIQETYIPSPHHLLHLTQKIPAKKQILHLRHLVFCGQFGEFDT